MWLSSHPTFPCARYCSEAIACMKQPSKAPGALLLLTRGAVDTAAPPAITGSVTFHPVLASSFVSPPQHASLARGSAVNGTAPLADNHGGVFPPAPAGRAEGGLSMF